MKTVFVLLTIFGLSFAHPTPRNLQDDLNDIIGLIPVDKVKAVLDDHLANDGAFVAVVEYLQGPEWAELVNTVHENPKVQEFEKYLTDAGVPVADIIAAIHDTIANAVPGTKPDDAGSLTSFLDDLIEVIPVLDLAAMILEKLQTSPDFQELYKKISSPEARELVEEVLALPEVQRLEKRLTEMGVPVQEILDAIYVFLGWTKYDAKAIAPRSLKDDLDDIIALIPVDKVKAVLDDHLANDGAFVAVVEYLQGPEWAELVNTVHENPKVQEFEKYLTDAGIPVADIIAAIHDTIANAVPGTKPDDAGSLTSFLDDLIEVIPVLDLAAMILEKLQTSPDFQELYKKISSPEARELVEEVLALPEVQRLEKRLTEMGVPVQEILDAIYVFLGWTKYDAKAIAPRSLKDDLDDIIALIPVDKVKAVLDDHLANDGAFVAVVEYLQGPEWAELVNTVHENPKVQEFEKYLTDAGIPVADIIAAIHDTIANAVPGTKPDGAGSLTSFLDDLIEVIPVLDLAAMILEKLQTSPDFQELYKKISSPEARELVEEVLALPEVQRLEKRLTEMGVPVQEILAAIYVLLGWN